jgi:PAS domain S-box-containing protein
MPRIAASVRFQFFTAFGVIAVVLWTGIAYTLHAAEREAMEKASAEGRNLARSLTEHVASSVRTIDLALLHLREEWGEDSGRFSDRVAREQKYLKYGFVPQISVIAADGRLAFASPPVSRGVDLSDRPHFKSQKERGTDELHISAPLLSRLSGQWRILFTRPIYDRNGKFAGVLVLSVPPPALERVYDDIDLGEGGRIALVRTDGQILGHSRDMGKATGVSLTDSPALSPDTAPAGEFRRKSLIDDIERLYRYQKVRGYPLTVIVGQSVDTILAPYHAQRTTSLVSGASATALLLALALLLVSRRIDEEQTGQYRSRLAAIVQGSDDAIISLDRDTKIVSWNAGAEHLFGYTEAEMLGQPISLAAPPDRLSEFAALTRRILEGEPLRHFETTYLAKDGRRIELLLGVSAIKNAEGGVVGASVIARDITERKRLEQALLQSEANLRRFRMAMDATEDAIYLVDRTSMRFIDINEAACRMQERTREELLALGPEGVLSTSREEMERIYDAVIGGGARTQPVERQRLRKDGSPIWLEIRRSAQRSDAGWMIVTVVRDITERKRAEGALRASEERFSKAFHASPDSITLSKLETGEFVEVNEGFVRISGYSSEEAIGRTAIELGIWSQANQRAELLAGLLAGKQVHSLETVLSTKDGAKRAVLISLEIIDLGGEKHMLTIGRDITERKQAEGEIRRLNESLEQRVKDRTRELERSNEELASFSYSVAHDLRTPLRGINGFSAILANEYAGKLDAAALGYLERIRAATVRMGDVMDDLLALAHASRAELQRQEVDLSAMAQAIAADLGSAAPQRGVEFAIAPGLMASADPGLIRIALDNLLGNAWKFSAKTEGAKIEFGLTTAEGQPVYFVRDNGAGFDPAYGSKLFAQFQRLHTDKEYEGTGIGLAIVARVIRRHGGRIWAEGAVGRGATFYFTLG